MLQMASQSSIPVNSPTSSTLHIGDKFATLQDLAAALTVENGRDYKFAALNDSMVCEYKAAYTAHAKKGKGYNTDCTAFAKHVCDGERYRITYLKLEHNHSIKPVSLDDDVAQIVFKMSSNRLILPKLDTALAVVKYSILKSVSQYAFENSLRLSLQASGEPRRNTLKFSCERDGCPWTWKVCKESKLWVVREYYTTHSHLLPPTNAGLGITTPTSPSPSLPFFPSIPEPAQSDSKPPVAIKEDDRSPSKADQIREFLLQVDSSGRLLPYIDRFTAEDADRSTLAQLPPDVLEKFLVEDLKLPWLHFAAIASFLDVQSCSTN